MRVRVQSRRAAGATAADDQHVRGVGRSQVQLGWHRTVAFEQDGQLAYRLLASVRAELDRTVGVLAGVRMVLLDQRVALGERVLEHRLLAACVTGDRKSTRLNSSH